MVFYFKRAVSDILSNGFLNIITIITIALSILVVSTFALFFENAGRILDSLSNGIRIMAYLEADFNRSELPGLENEIMKMKHIKDVTFISKEQALALLKKEMSTRKAFLDNLNENPLPDALEIELDPSAKNLEVIGATAASIEKSAQVSDVEYGEKWLQRFVTVFHFFRITGYAMSSLFFLIALFITANTVRLSLYSRREEVEIMRLVGANDSFIVTPFYIEGFLQGIIGGSIGLGILFLAYVVLLSSGLEMKTSFCLFFDIRFLSPCYTAVIILSSAFLGWLGCFISLKQFLKN
ncbi:MAG: permease-like cell division protein FtsX [Desulfobacteraceae bacterium]